MNEKNKVEIEGLHPNLKIYEYENNAESCSLNDIDIKIIEPNICNTDLQKTVKGFGK